MKKTMLITASISLSLLLTACVNQPQTQSAENLNNTDISIGIPIPDQPNINANTEIQVVEVKPTQNRIVKEDIYLSNYQQYPEVVRYDRYTLVSSSPAGGQKYLLEQLVNINMPVKNKAYTLTVEQGIKYTLKETGYSLCHFSPPDVRQLFRLSLPKVHYKFGPMKLRDALQMLAGEAFELTVNDAQREVCFTTRAVVPQPMAPIKTIQADVIDIDITE